MNKKRLLTLMGTTNWYSHTLTLKPDAAAGVDAQIRSSTPDSNYGTSGDMNIGGVVDWRAVIKFDLSKLPANARITSAKLKLYCLADNCTTTPVYSIYRLKVPFIESQVTYNSRITGTAWATPGAFGEADCEQTPICARNMTASETLNKYHEFILTPTTKAGLDLGNGWLIRSNILNADGYAYATSDAVDANTRPTLIIEYTDLNP